MAFFYFMGIVFSCICIIFLFIVYDVIVESIGKVVARNRDLQAKVRCERLELENARLRQKLDKLEGAVSAQADDEVSS